MAAKKTKNPLAKLMALPGVGKVAATKLQKAGIKTPAGIKKAGAKGLVKAGLSAALAKKLLAGSSKAAAKKVAPKKKAAAKKKAPAKKKAAAKKKAPAKPSNSKSDRRGSDLKAPSLAEMLKRIKANK